MLEQEEMELFLREMLMNIESEQSQIIRRLEDSHRRIESLNREKVLVEEKLKDNVSFFNPISAKNREVLEEINEKILEGHKQTNEIKDELQDINQKIVTMGKILNFIREHKEDNEEKEEVSKDGISILQAQERDRKRIAMDLHDSTVQSLTNVVHKAEYCSKMLERDPVQVKLELDSMMENVRKTIQDMRNIIYDLRPMSIDDLGLVPTIHRFIEQQEQNYEDIDFSISVKSETDEVDLPSVVTITIFRIIQEACNNIIKHANAKNVALEIFYKEDCLAVTVTDDGDGFQIDEEKKKTNGFGLSIMRERAQLLGGTLNINSFLSEGTSVEVCVPYTVIERIRVTEED